MASEAKIYMLEDEKKRPRRRRDRMPPVVQHAVNLLKAEERKALLKSLEVNDAAVAEMLRVAAVAYDQAATIVLFAYDEVARRPSL